MTEAFLMDCMEAMKGMKDKAFDLAVVDPIYGGVTQGGYMQNNCGNKAKPNEYHNGIWNQEKTGEAYFQELFRVSQNQIIWGGKLLHDGNQAGFPMLDCVGQGKRREQICGRRIGLDQL